MSMSPETLHHVKHFHMRITKKLSWHFFKKQFLPISLQILYGNWVEPGFKNSSNDFLLNPSLNERAQWKLGFNCQIKQNKSSIWLPWTRFQRVFPYSTQMFLCVFSTEWKKKIDVHERAMCHYLRKKWAGLELDCASSMETLLAKVMHCKKLIE